MDQDTSDPQRPRAPRPFESSRGYSGQDYRVTDEQALGREFPAGSVAPTGPASAVSAPRGDIHDVSDDNGRRAQVDPVTGEVRGSGVGAGGGASGEDFDNDSATGDGPVVTGEGSRNGEP